MTLKNGPSGAQVAQPTVNCTWDNADRLTQITQAAGASNNNVAQTVGFTYDNANRTTKVTYTGGQSINTTYTDANEVLSITCKKPDGSVIASGTYTYDAAGRRTGVTGDLATFVQATGADVTDASYNAANQLTKWSGKTFVYDKNGNLTSDGVSSYQWDARGQLAGITGGTTASFQYDVQRRRIAKTLGGTTTAFNYDGDNFVQELSGTGTSSAVKANLLTGGIDQLFVRSVSGTTATLNWVLPEANNHAIILTDSTGATKQTYAYEPYGRTTPSGTDTNSQQYTGRENDGTGLYYYRNRYYMPGCMRFISEDPIGWASGQTNNYAYVGGDPISNVDPEGLWSVSVGAFPGVGAQFTFGQNPNGSGFMSMQFGWGIGGGFSYNPLGKQPGYEECQGASWGVGAGVYGQASFRAGPIGAAAGANLGRNFRSDGSKLYGGFPASSSIKDRISGINASVSLGGQLTVFGGGTAQGGNTCGQ